MKARSIFCFTMLLAIASIGYSAEYRLFNDNFLTVGNQWHYDMHITILENEHVNYYETADITVTGTANIGSYTDAAILEFSSYMGSNSSYCYMTPEFILELGTEYSGGDVHEVYRNDNPLEMYPVWVDTSYDEHHLGSGDISVTQDDPSYTWTESHNTYVTYIGRETVSVPAGTFDCTTVYILTEWTDSDGYYGYEQETISIDPHIGIIRSLEYYWTWDNYAQAAYVDECSFELSSTNVVPQAYCKVRSLPMDFDGDCKVGLSDFAIFAQSWLDCQIDYPEGSGSTGDLPDPIAHWTLDDNAAGTAVIDSSLNANNGTASSNTDTFSQAGIIGRCLNFGGTKLVTVPDYDAFRFGNGTTDSPFSISAWIYVSGSGTYQIIGKNMSDINGQWLLRISSSNLYFICIDDNADSYIFAKSTPLTPGWHHVAATYDGSGSQYGMNIYTDNSLAVLNRKSYGNYTAMDSGGAYPVAIGGRNDVWHLYNNKLDDIKIYNKELSASQVGTLFNE